MNETENYEDYVQIKEQTETDIITVSADVNEYSEYLGEPVDVIE